MMMMMISIIIIIIIMAVKYIFVWSQLELDSYDLVRPQKVFRDLF